MYIAAEQAVTKAQVKLGDMYTNGYRVPKDATEAMKWYRKAAEQGDTYAQFRIGGMEAAGASPAMPHRASPENRSLGFVESV